MNSEIKDQLSEIQADLSNTEQMLGDMHADIDHIGDMVSETQSETFRRLQYDDLFFTVGVSLIPFSFLFKMIK